MLDILKLSPKDCLDCYNLFSNHSKDLTYFKNLGWNFHQFKKQFLKKTNFGIGFYNHKIIEGFIFGDLINIKNILEYEIFLIYVNHNKRKLGYGTKLLKEISLILKEKKIKKIYLEVAENNLEAIKLYIKNGYKNTGIRKKYYKIKNCSVDAYLFEKNIND